MSMFARFALGLFLMAPTLNSYAFSAYCGVPVCNISETLSQLRNMTSDQRGMFALDLMNTHKNAMDVKVLENLRQAGMEMKSLFIELGDADWVQRAASDLINTAVFNLAKYSDIDGELLGELYGQLSNQTFRYNMIIHWHGKLKSLEDTSTIEELIVFADRARSHSLKIGDEDWIPRAAGALISDATIRLIHLDPSHEGLYKVDVQGAHKYIKALAFDRIAVLDSSSSKNLIVVMINTRLKAIVHSFSHAELIGNTISGLVLSNGEVPSRFSMTIERESGEVKGMVETTRDGVVNFYGQQLISTRSVFQEPQQASSEKDFLGTMQGELGGVKGSLTVRSFKEDIYSATFASETGSIILNFQGKYFSQNGVLSLTSSEKIKLTLALRNGLWKGFSFSTVSGTHAPASFKSLK